MRVLCVSVAALISVLSVTQGNVAPVQKSKYEDFFLAEKEKYYRIEKRDLFNQTVCYDDLGCFSTGAPFYDIKNRPLSVVPAKPDSIGTQFLLYTRKNPSDFQSIKAKDATSIKASNFDPNKHTKIIVHGWTDSTWFGDWMGNMKDEWLMHGDYNVIITDWSGGNGLPYTQATANTRVVGAQIAQIIQYLEEQTGVKPESFHIMGHSLGAHVAGYAGERLKRLGRITGMDPAGPNYDGTAIEVRLDSTDAQFVDIIHTDTRALFPYIGLGTSTPSGHIDFYPNGGEVQAGCEKSRLSAFLNDGFAEGVRRMVTCNHHRAVQYMTETINQQQCKIIGYNCASWENFETGMCTDCGKHGEKCVQMGPEAEKFKAYINDKESFSVYLKTNDQNPFCQHHYLVSVTLANADFGKEQGKLVARVHGKVAEGELQLSTNDEDFTHGDVHRYVAANGYNFGTVEKVSLNWQRTGSVWDWIKWESKHELHIANIEISTMFGEKLTFRSSDARKANPEPKVLKPNENVVFTMVV